LPFHIKHYIFQIRVLASDGGVPRKTDTTVVKVNVDRNLNTPHMTKDEYLVNILETQHLGVPFIQVGATDDDQKVSSICYLSYKYLFNIIQI